jgi:hypothetical protein
MGIRSRARHLPALSANHSVSIHTRFTFTTWLLFLYDPRTHWGTGFHLIRCQNTPFHTLVPPFAGQTPSTGTLCAASCQLRCILTRSTLMLPGDGLDVNDLCIGHGGCFWSQSLPNARPPPSNYPSLLIDATTLFFLIKWFKATPNSLLLSHGHG